MEPENYHFGGGTSETILHPLVLVAMLVAILLILTVSRRKVAVPFLLIAFMTPLSQAIYVGGLHWQVLRVVILAGCLRLVLEQCTAKSNLFPRGLNGIDWAFVVYALCMGLVPIVRFQTAAAIPIHLAYLLNAFGGYFFLRFAIQDDKDIRRVAKALAPLALVLGLCMATERSFNVNIFGYTDSLPIHPVVRNGLVRAQASFAHPILAGCFGATVLPLFYWLRKCNNAKGLGTIGILGSLLMVFFCASSTPLLACAGGIVALLLWPIRRSMRLVRWGILLTLGALQVLMKADVWYLVARVNLTGSSDAWSRAMLIDHFIRHFTDWWLIGADTNNWGWSMWDVCNAFVAAGVRGGLLAFLCLITIISRCLGGLGKMRRRAEGNRGEWLYWSLCAVMFAHIVAYFGVNYFDQTGIWWYAFLAMVSAATVPLNSSMAKPEVATYASELEPPTCGPETVGSDVQASQRHYVTRSNRVVWAGLSSRNPIV